MNPSLHLPSLFDWAFSSNNPGYRPTVVELPHGDGRADTGKRYAHISSRYGLQGAPDSASELWYSCLREARELTAKRDLPSPDPAECCLRVLEYPAGAGSEAHTDFDLLTINVWRAPVEGLLVPARHHAGRVHFGELSPMFEGPEATWHAVAPLPVPQRSIVLFVLPSRDTLLPDGQTVGQWLDERKARSRA